MDDFHSLISFVELPKNRKLNVVSFRYMISSKGHRNEIFVLLNGLWPLRWEGVGS